MARSIERCLGAVVVLCPLAAMLAMIVYGVPRMVPGAEGPGWLAGENTTPTPPSTDSDRGPRQADAKSPATHPRSAPPLPATSRRPRQSQQMAESRATRLSWNQVRTRLAAHRVDEFRIQPGSRPGEVHFSCLQPVPGRVRVLRRFEAEAADPVRAARDVLQQIEQSDRGLTHVAGTR